mmetsp:Transcript_2345/g.3289  ORF Transcript_2345/g.3289 Transcript_2345/m.3289 type:complete len:336 (-) Transcript_2345:237-1244(-)
MVLSISEISSRFESSASNKECVGHKKKVHALAWNKNGTILASGSVDTTARLWELDSQGKGVLLHELKGHSDSIDQLCWNPRNAEQLATTSSDKTVRIWNAKTGTQTHLINTVGENINIAWSPDGTSICVGNKEDMLTFIETKRFRISSEIKFGYEANEFRWSPNSEYFFITSGQSNGMGTIEVMRFSKGKLFANDAITLYGHSANCYSLDFDPTGRYFAVGAADSLVSIWSLEDLVCVRTTPRLEWPVRTVSFSYDGRLLAAAAEDHFIDISDVETGEVVYQVNCRCAMNSVAWHPSKMILAYAGDFNDKSSSSSSRDRDRQTAFIRMISISEKK